MTLLLPQDQLDIILEHAAARYPEEACGLLIGQRRGDVRRIVRVEASPNLADDPGRRFEIDPRLQFRLMRELRGSDFDIIGHYHSHPDGAAEPSATDLAMAYEPDFAWLIVAVAAGEPRAHAAFELDGNATRFQSLEVILA